MNMNKERRMRRAVLLLSSSVIATTITTGVAQAQVADKEGLTDIVVTARKRDETSIAVPVVVTAVGAKELERRAISNLDAIARVVPQLMISSSGGAVQGGAVSLRGISGPTDNPFGDSAVSFNVDGVAIGKTSVRRMADFDLQQIEVLKGPQALFYGKNSPAGIVSMRTGDPTSKFEAKISTGYEFYAHETRTEGYISGPITQHLGFRVAGYFSDMDGWLKNVVPSTAYLAAGASNRAPNTRTYGIRGTLAYDNDAGFTAKLKVTYGDTNNPSGPASTNEFVYCPTGARQTGSGGPCSAGPNQIVTSIGKAAGDALPNVYPNGSTFQKQSQLLTSLEMNYNLNDNVKLTSVSGLYRTKLDQAANYESDFTVALPSRNFLKQREISEELRVASSYDGPLNFTAGVYYANTYASGGSLTTLYAAEQSGATAFGLPLRYVIPVNNYDLTQRGKAYSAFLQLSYKPIQTVEIDVGGRYSYEKKRMTHVRTSLTSVFPLTDANEMAIDPRSKAWHDFSPEVTVSYRPTNRLTFFGSYKHGFLSGGFNSGAVNYALSPNISYDQETIKGFEAGAKALLLDGNLRLNLAAYHYKLKGLQLTNFVNATSTIRNAGSATIKGIEFDATYRTPLPGLSLNGAVAYNRAIFGNVGGSPCYAGQTNALGCFMVPVETSGGTVLVPQQDLEHKALPNAPKLNLIGGFAYETPLSDTLKIGLSGTATYISSYFTDTADTPSGRERGYTLVDATLRLSSAADIWAVELIGRNLTNKYYYNQSNDVPFTGSGTGTTTGQLADRYANVSRGREVMIRLSYKFAR